MNKTIEFVVRSILIGAGATFAMDVWAAVLRRFGVPSLNFAFLGRWIGHLTRGRWLHESIAKTAPVQSELLIGWCAHYSIGITFAAVLLAAFGSQWARSPTLLPALLIGLVTVAAPLFILQPALGAGIASSKTPAPSSTASRACSRTPSSGSGSSSRRARRPPSFHEPSMSTAAAAQSCNPIREHNCKEPIMSTRQRTTDEQAALWNGDAGRAWVDAQQVLDGPFKPFEDQLVDAVRGGSAQSVLDVGCGTGATTLAMARSLGASGRCVGVDISEPMLALAQARAERERVPAIFIRADAEIHAFEPGGFDMIVSRFGVMFFDDVGRAFTNLRRAGRDGAALRLIAWRSAAENPFMTTAERAAAPLLPNMPPRRPDAPGQFAFGDRARVERVLEQSGWAEIDVQPIDVALAFAEKDLDLYLTRLGPLGRMLAETDEQARIPVIAKVRQAFDPYVHGDEVRFDAACWTICARAGGLRPSADRV